MMTRQREWLIDDFEDHGTGEIVANQSGTTWAAEAADDDLASVVAGSVLVGTNCLRILDESNTNQASVTKTTPRALGTGDIARIGSIKPVSSSLQGTATLPISFVLYKLREGATVVIWLAIDLYSGYVYYSTDSGTSYTDTGIHLTLDAANTNLDVEITSTTTFKVRLNGGTWTSALANDNTMTTSITKIEFTTPAAHGYEGFNSYADAHRVINENGWNNWTTDVAFDFVTATISGSQRCRAWKTGAAGASFNPTLTFPTAATTVGSLKVTIRRASAPSNWVYWNVLTAAGTVLVELYDTGTNLYCTDNITARNLGTWTTSTDYEITIAWPDNAHYIVTFKGVGSATYTYKAAATGFPGKFNFYVSNDGRTCDFSLDNIITDWANALADVDSIDCYIDEMRGIETSDTEGVQFYRMKYLSTASSLTIVSTSVPIHLSDGSMLVAATADGIYRVTNPTSSSPSWEEVIDDASTNIGVFIEEAAGVVVCAYKYDEATGLTTCRSSDNYGATWGNTFTLGADIAGDDTDNQLILDLCWTGTNTFAISRGANRLHVDQRNGDAWVAKDSEVIVEAAITDGGYARCVHIGDYIYWAADDNDDATFFKYQITTTTISQVAVITTDYGITRLWPAALWNDGGALFWVPVAAGTDYRTAYSSDTGATWAIYTVDENMIASPTEQVRSGEHVHMFETVRSQRYEFVTDLSRPTLRETMSEVTGTFVAITDEPLIFSQSGTDVYIYSMQDDAENIIATADLYWNIVTSSSLSSHVEFTTSNANQGYFNVGDDITFYDEYSDLWFQGKVTTKSKGEGITTFEADGPDIEVKRPHGSAFVAKKISEMLTEIINGYKRGYVGSIQDVNTLAGGIDYDPRGWTSAQPVYRMARVIERAVIYTTPLGAWYLTAHDNLTSTGYRVCETTTQWRMRDNTAPELDSRITRATTLTSATTRTTYVGNSAREITEGETMPAEYEDSAFPNASATTLATQLYTILALASSYINLFVHSHGVIQPGHSIDFSWSLGDTTVTRATLCILGLHANMKTDEQELVISNNIVSRGEYADQELDTEGTKGGLLTFRTYLPGAIK